MKESILVFVLVLAVAGLAQPAPAPAQGSSGATGQAAAPQQQQINDPAEYQAFMAAYNQKDPALQIQQVEAFLQQYPNSVAKEDALDLLLGDYQKTGDMAKLQETATRLLQVDPKNIRALALMAYVSRSQAQAGQNAPQNAQAALQYGQRGLQALATMSKPEGMSDADFQKFKQQTSAVFNGAAGFGALQAKDYATATKYLRAAVETNPNAGVTDLYPLAVVYLEQKPPDTQGLYFIARAADLAAGTPAQAQIAAYGKSRYVQYHGSEEGWNELLAQARNSPLPPPTFMVKPAPSPAEQAALLVQHKPVSQMSFDEIQLVLTSGNQPAAAQVWDALKDKPIALEGKLISASSPEKLNVAGSYDDGEKNVADVTVNMVAPIPARLMPKVGSDFDFQAVPASYTANPFLMIMNQGKLAEKPAPARKATPARRPQ